MYYIYVLKSKKFRYSYTGLTHDIDDRFQRHELGYEKTTKRYRPFTLIFLTTVVDRITARMIEKYMKSGIGREFIKGLC